jgi:hypothetical protein
VSRQENELPVDSYLPAKEVDPVERKAEALALAQPGAGGQDHERAIAVGDGLDDAGLERFDTRGSAFGSRIPMAGFCGMTRSATAARKMETAYR